MKESQVTTSPKELDSNQKFMAALTYLVWFLTGIIFLLYEKKDKFIRFHAYQSTATFVLLLGLIIIGLILPPIPFLGALINLVLWIGWIVLWIVLMYRAFQGEKYKLPYVGEWAEKQVAKE
ncbi:hypothetical protein A2Z23_03100 [Candidatus Curtissbacteria bacterium RBG_16_39_7]|uniref:DUF4870 domain-containing protein n=1 Tax=Candidatus Curtissbacteria bacterium RBG_16_39_7 TaxID=1797707 RepID=A0A1F5G4B8_9BACT|nr:MAG: hypothetical protein A2Z23_03100 [Candidatus Curtissbacteria bacterium RBG_16_39_7]